MVVVFDDVTLLQLSVEGLTKMKINSFRAGWFRRFSLSHLGPLCLALGAKVPVLFLSHIYLKTCIFFSGVKSLRF